MLSACSSTPEQANVDNRVYYPTMNDSIAMAAVFKTTVMDTTYLGAGPNAGQVDEVKPRWAWKALNLDSLKVRYPEAQVEGSTSEPIVVYYSPVDNALATQGTEKYELNYTAELPFFQQDRVNLGENEGIATFLKNEKGWYLMNNIPNTYAREQRESASKADKSAENERLVTLNWSNESRPGNSMACASRSYKTQTIYGSNILEVPKGQVWVPVAGKSKLRPDSQVFFDVQIEADDETSNSTCYFGALRYLPENKTKNVARAKDEFHKYYAGTKLRLWGRLQSNEVTMLIIGPGPLPKGATTAAKQAVATSYVPTPEPVQNKTQNTSAEEEFNLEMFGLFGDIGKTQEFTGKVGNLSATYSLKLDNQLGVTGSYFYTNKPAKGYALEGKLIEGGTMTLTEYDGDEETATCTLKLSGNCYTGRMQNTDGRSFPMSICK